jgi:CubicO group peptidase (beta-lactamase class C family)
MDYPRRKRPRRLSRATIAALGAILVAIGARAASRAPSQGDEARDASFAAAALPRTVGFDAERMDRALEEAAGLPQLHALVVGRHGEVVVEQRFRGRPLNAPANVKSVSKSVLSALVGIAIGEGHLAGVDQPIAPFFQRQIPADDDPRRRAITVGHLLTMQSGLESTSGARYGSWVSSPDWVRHALSRPVVAEPGGRRIYSTGNSHLLSAMLTQATGRNTWAYARSVLAEPLGIQLPRWPADPQGIHFGGNDMLLTPRAMFRFGELYRNGGRHGDRQIVPAWWVEESLRPRVPLGGGESYGYAWFIGLVRGHRMFYAWGYGGQFIFVIPSLEMTVVATSDPGTDREPGHVRAIRRILAQFIVPAAEIGSGPEL